MIKNPKYIPPIPLVSNNDSGCLILSFVVLDNDEIADRALFGHPKPGMFYLLGIIWRNDRMTFRTEIDISAELLYQADREGLIGHLREQVLYKYRNHLERVHIPEQEQVTYSANISGPEIDIKTVEIKPHKMKSNTKISDHLKDFL